MKITLFQQIKHHGDNFSYIIADQTSKEAVVVDPSFNGEELIRSLKAENLSLKYIVCTHGHSDHIADNYELRSAIGGEIVAHERSRIRADIKVEEGAILKVGKLGIKIIYTPGHTTDGICLLVEGKLLTGDTLFIGECGRVDLPGGNASSLYDSLFNKLLKLDDNIEVYPGHDYGLKPYSTIGEERKSNYVLKPRSLEEFIDFIRLP